MKNRKRIVSIVALILAAVMLIGLVASVIPYAFAANSDEIKEEIKKLEEESAKIDEKKAELQEQIDAIDADKASVLEQKALIDQQINLTLEEIANTEAKIEQYDRLVGAKKASLQEAEAAEAALYELYKARIRAMEEGGTVSYIAILFNANSFTDLLDRLEWITAISDADKLMMSELSAATAVIQAAKDDLLDAQALQEEQAALLEEQKQTLQKQSDESQAIVDKLAQDSAALAVIQDTYDDEMDALLKKISEKQEEYEKEKLKEEEAKRKEQEALAGSTGNGGNGGNGGGNGGGSGDGSAPSFIRPCSGGWISSPYGSRMHPTLGYERMHYGIDYAVNLGTPIYASASGKVTIATTSEGEGNWVMISHSNGFATAYLHLFSYSVSVGQQVSQGQVIGYSGNTGTLSSGYHLHFAMYHNGNFVNPANYL